MNQVNQEKSPMSAMYAHASAPAHGAGAAEGGNPKTTRETRYLIGTSRPLTGIVRGLGTTAEEDIPV